MNLHCLLCQRALHALDRGSQQLRRLHVRRVLLLADSVRLCDSFLHSFKQIFDARKQRSEREGESELETRWGAGHERSSVRGVGMKMSEALTEIEHALTRRQEAPQSAHPSRPESPC